MLANFQSQLAIAVFPLVVYTALAFTIASGLHYSYKSVKIIASYQVPGDAKKGLKILEVEAGSVAEEIGLAPGDQILEVNGYEYLTNSPFSSVFAKTAWISLSGE